MLQHRNNIAEMPPFDATYNKILPMTFGFYSNSFLSAHTFSLRLYLFYIFDVHDVDVYEYRSKSESACVAVCMRLLVHSSPRYTYTHTHTRFHFQDHLSDCQQKLNSSDSPKAHCRSSMTEWIDENACD